MGKDILIATLSSGGHLQTESGRILLTKISLTAAQKGQIRRIRS